MLFICIGLKMMNSSIDNDELLDSDQNSVSHFLFLAANTLSHLRLSLILLCKNTSSNQDLHCNEIRGRQRWVKVIAAKNKKCDSEF